MWRLRTWQHAVAAAASTAAAESRGAVPLPPPGAEGASSSLAGAAEALAASLVARCDCLRRRASLGGIKRPGGRLHSSLPPVPFLPRAAAPRSSAGRGRRLPLLPPQPRDLIRPRRHARPTAAAADPAEALAAPGSTRELPSSIPILVNCSLRGMCGGGRRPTSVRLRLRRGPTLGESAVNPDFLRQCNRL